MATSHFHQISLMMPYVEMLRPSSILDVGAGIGKWGFLCRDRLEFLEGRYDRINWQTRVYGVEVYPEYKNPIWEHFYDRFWVGDILDVLGEIPKIELVILADVIEHIPKDRGQDLLQRLAKKGDFFLISTPKRFFRGNRDSNPASDHRSYWDSKDFESMWAITEELGDTRVFFVDVHREENSLFIVNAAERHSFGGLWMALLFKIFRKLMLPTGRVVSPRDLKRLTYRS